MKLARHVDAGREPEAGRADLVERNAADGAGQTDGAAGLVLDPAHAELVRSHVGPGNVVGDIADGVGEGADELLLSLGRHARIAEDHRLAAAVRQAGGGVLPGHRAREPEAFLDRDIGRHAHAADRRTAGGVVDDDDRLQADAGPVNMDDPGRAELVGKSKHVFHWLSSGSRRALRDRR